MCIYMCVHFVICSIAYAYCAVCSCAPQVFAAVAYSLFSYMGFAVRTSTTCPVAEGYSSCAMWQAREACKSTCQEHRNSKGNSQ